MELKDKLAAEKLIEEKAQKIADAMVAKRLSKMPTKEELKEFQSWKRCQNSEQDVKIVIPKNRVTIQIVIKED